MTKKKTIEEAEEKLKPQALIIGGGIVAGYLSRILHEKGCQVELVISPSQKPSSRFDYIFQFGGIESLEEISQKNLNKNGKLLFIETEIEEIKGITSEQKFRIIRIGDQGLWDISELAEKILKSMFSISISSLVDVRKKSSLPKPKIPDPAVVLRPPEVSSASLPKTEPARRKKGFFSKKLFFLVFLGSIIFIIFGCGYWYISSLGYTYDNFRSHLASGDFTAVVSDLKEARVKLQMGKSFYSFTNTVLFPLKNTSFMQEIEGIFTVSDDLLQTGEDVLSFPYKFKIVRTNSFLTQADFSRADFENLKTKINSLGNSIVSAKQKMEVVTLPFFPKESFTTFLGGFYNKLTGIHQILPVAEEILTGEKTKTYLFLFQNNMELRPTGGFIGSFALVTFGNGKILEFKIMDVYTADGQLTGHVDPPAAIRKYLSQPNFFLRDSNFDPDFAASSLQASWFLQKELGVNVDGVVGVNLFLIQNLLKIVGPLNLPDFGNEQVTADNFFFKAQFFAQKDFFAGSTQKKDFLTAVAKAIEIKLTTGGNLPWFELLTVVKNALDEKNLLLYSSEEKMQKMIEERGWGGRTTDVTCLDKSVTEKLANPDIARTCLADYLSIIEANLGVNKANYFVSKSVTIEKKIETNGQLTNSVTLSYENKSLSQVFYGGTYVDYLRFFVPAGTKLLSATFNNVPISSTELDTESYAPDKTSFGFLVKIAPENKGVVKIVYVSPKPFAIETSSYQFLYQKQGGDKTSPLVFSLILPPGLKLKPANFKSSASRENEIYYTTDTSVDRIFAMEKSN